MRPAVDTVILAGGRGTRLQPYTTTIPKPLLPLGDLPVLEIIIRQLANAGVPRVILTIGHMAPLFTAFFGDGSRFGLAIEYRAEEEPLGTAGPLRDIPDISDPFLVMNGDTLTTLDYGHLIEQHLASGAPATIATVRRHEYIDLGVVETKDGFLTAYREKPTLDYVVSMGINVLSKHALEWIPKQGAFDMPDLFLALVDAGEKVFCCESDCYWQDIGRFDDFQKATRDFSENPERFLPNGP